jgi:hypothetical protein
MSETNESFQLHPALMEDIKLSSEVAEYYRRKAEEARLDEEAQAWAATAMPEAVKQYEQCGYKYYRLPGECGGEMRAEHTYGHGHIVDLCDRHYEVAPDPRLITGGLSSENMLLLCKAWKERNYPVLAEFAELNGEVYFVDDNGKTIEPSGTVRFQS